MIAKHGSISVARILPLIHFLLMLHITSLLSNQSLPIPSRLHRVFMLLALLVLVAIEHHSLPHVVADLVILGLKAAVDVLAGLELLSVMCVAGLVMKLRFAIIIVMI